MYIPKPPPPTNDNQAIVEWLDQELQALSRALEAEEEVVWFQPLAVEPVRPRNGQTAFADGVNWNPGAGAGLYSYWSGAWRLLFGSGGVGVVESVFGRTGDVVALVADYDDFYSLLGHLHDDRYYTETEVDATFAAHETTIANHGDVTFTVLVDNDFIQRKVGVWVNRTPAQVAADLVHGNLQGVGVNTHAQIDTHIARTDNPHAVTKAQVGLGSVDNVSAASLRDRATHTGTEPTSAFATGPGLITAAMMNNGIANSVIGRPSSTDGVRIDIVAMANDTLLRRVSNALGFGQLTLGMIPDGLITFLKIATGAIATQAENEAGTAADKLVTPLGSRQHGDARYALVSHTHTLSQITDAGLAAAADVKNSIEINLGDLQLVGDEAAPTADKYYGTNNLGARGFFALPSGGGASALNDLSDVTLSALGADELLFTQDGATFINQTLAEADIASATALSSHTGDTANPHAVTKAQVGLGSVDNVSAADLRARSTHTGTEPATAFATGPGVISLAMLDNATDTSVVGRALTGTGPRADIVAADNQLLGRAGGTLGFMQLVLDMIPNAMITFAKLATGAIATQAEAEAGTAAEKLMTPLRSRQHGDARYLRRTAHFLVHQGGTPQTISSATVTKVVWGAEDIDEGNFFDLVNSKWVPPAGLVIMNASLRYTSGIVDQASLHVRFHKNGVVLYAPDVIASGTGTHRPNATVFDIANGTDEYEIFAFATGAGDKTVSGASSNTYWTGFVLE